MHPEAAISYAVLKRFPHIQQQQQQQQQKVYSNCKITLDTN